MATSLCASMWWCISHAFVRGAFFTSFARVDLPYAIFGSYISWFWDLSFVCAACTIISGGMAERVKFLGYCAYVLWLSGAVYPFVAHWEWTADGFLSVYNPDAALPMLDFAGCGAVHLVGGTASLLGAWMIGPRPGAFIHEMPVYTKKEYKVQDRLASTLSLYSVVGVMILWIGWYGFNCGSAGGIVGKSDVVGLVAVNTTLAAMVGALFASTLSYFQYHLFKVDMVLMGILSGLVSITGPAPYVRCHMTVPIAIIGFLIYHFLVWFLLKIGIDDPVSSFPIHGGCGFWGLLASGFFQDSELSGVSSWGTQLGKQFAGAFIIAGWTATLSLAFLFFLHIILHGLRSADSEAEFRRDAGHQNAHGPRGNVTLLFTDIQSSTVLWETDEESMEEALAQHDNVFRTTLQLCNGFEVKTEGDAFMCAFATTADCAKFCCEVQHGLMAVKWPKLLYSNASASIEEDGTGTIIWKGLRVRMGFHSGEPTAQENPLTQRTDYFGKDVNYASRISSVGAGGQIMLSSASVKDLLPLCQDTGSPFEEEEPFGLVVGERYVLPTLECYLEYLGRKPLKGITSAHEDGEHVYQVRPFGLEARRFITAGAAVEVAEPLQSVLGSLYCSSAPQTPKSVCSEISGIPLSPRGRRARNFPTGIGRLPAGEANPVVSHQAWIPEEASDTISVNLGQPLPV
eukprot:GGOE01012128.1.p1 GENE.GGOE01012128.1~~GGOE01012128.1.p1  ORF type:complete len:761 (-),score=167.57 GGOE01012128.1:1753-3804(-)